MSDSVAHSDMALPQVHIRGTHRLTLDIGPLLDSQWTGIPVFTRRLAESLMQDGRIGLSFCRDLTLIPNNNVYAAIRAGTGTFLRQDYEEHSQSDFAAVDPAAPILYPSVKNVYPVSSREASVVHDISTLVMPENHEPANVSHHLDHFVDELGANETIFCVSEATKCALEAYFPSAAGRTRILYQYVDWPPDFSIIDRNLPRLAIGRYAVVVGTIEPRKNLSILLKALSLPSVEHSDLKFVVIGKVGWLVEEFLSALSPSQRSRLIFSGFVSDLIKYRLIAAAEFMVFPSMYEGFGIPALEALSLGKPVLASRTSSFPEVIEDAGLYFDPVSVEDFVGCLDKMMFEDTRTQLASKALRQSERFNWRRMAEPVVKWVMQN